MHNKTCSYFIIYPRLNAHMMLPNLTTLDTSTHASWYLFLLFWLCCNFLSLRKTIREISTIGCKLIKWYSNSNAYENIRIKLCFRRTSKCWEYLFWILWQTRANSCINFSFHPMTLGLRSFKVSLFLTIQNPKMQWL
jgi:hypothetical protein